MPLKTAPPGPTSAAATAAATGQPTLPGRIELGSFMYTFLSTVRITEDSYDLVSKALAAAVALLIAGKQQLPQMRAVILGITKSGPT